MKGFVKDFLSDADVDGGNVRVGVIVFSVTSKIEFHLNKYSTKADIFAAIDAAKYMGKATNTADSLKRTRTEMFTLVNGDRPNVNDIVILLTDGKSSENTKRTIP